MPTVLKKNPDGTPHIHVYIRRNKNSYKCMDPLCSHWMPKNELKGKASTCSVCLKNEIILDYTQLKLARPRCNSCANTKESQEHRAKLEQLKELGII